MKNVLIDSDIIIEILRGNIQIASLVKKMWQKGSQFSYSPITVAEVRAGMRPAEKKVTMDLFESMECITIDTSIAEKAGEYLQAYRRSQGVELGDALIAATAFVDHSELLTLNRKHYPMSDIKLIKW
jgi:predicted nucleic acid-binding protein